MKNLFSTEQISFHRAQVRFPKKVERGEYVPGAAPVLAAAQSSFAAPAAVQQQEHDKHPVSMTSGEATVVAVAEQQPIVDAMNGMAIRKQSAPPMSHADFDYAGQHHHPSEYRTGPHSAGANGSGSFHSRPATASGGINMQDSTFAVSGGSRHERQVESGYFLMHFLVHRFVIFVVMICVSSKREPAPFQASCCRL
jgi:hypothetical protein